MNMTTRQLAVRFSIASAILFSALVVMQVASGASQQFFEVVHPPAVYAREIVARAGWLRVVIGVDDIFIGCYVAAGVLTALTLPRRALTFFVMAGAVMVGLLDLEENHHMLALLRAAESAMPLDPADIVRRMDASTTKFAIGHLAFFFIAFLVPGRSGAARALRVLCGVVQLPLGIAGVVWDGSIPVQIGRAVCYSTAYVLLAVVMSRLPDASAAASATGARASRPDTMPGAAA